ncbi:MAG: hypothetical protein ACFFAE_21420 [Candidatus Hodarchaeota archaeon]
MAKEVISGITVWCGRKGIHTSICPLEEQIELNLDPNDLFNCDTCLKE